MNPKQAAEQIVDKYYPFLNDYSTYSRPDEELQIVVEKGQKFGRAKQCAIIHVNGIIEAMSQVLNDTIFDDSTDVSTNATDFWNDVLNEIENL